MIRQPKRVKEILEDILQSLLQNKEVLSLYEGSIYCSLSESTMYKKTSAKEIPHYKPEGKKVYFKRSELDDWLLRNRQSTQEELEAAASKHDLK